MLLGCPACGSINSWATMFMRIFLFLMLVMLITHSAKAESFRCGKVGIEFEIKDGRVTTFNAQKAVQDESLANGYTLTCVQHISKFSQSRRGKEYTLRYTSDGQYGESQNCSVLITELASSFRVQSSNCHSECMNLNFDFDKKGNECYHSP